MVRTHILQFILFIYASLQLKKVWYYKKATSPNHNVYNLTAKITSKFKLVNIISAALLWRFVKLASVGPSNGVSRSARKSNMAAWALVIVRC